jgi:hypothetical protein
MHARTKLALYLLVALCALGASTLAFAQRQPEASRVKQATECMLRVLAAVPGVSDPKAGIAAKDPGLFPPVNGGIPRMYVEYRAAEGASWTAPTRFLLQRVGKDHVYFTALLPGQVPSSSALPDTHVTNVVVKKWESQCGVYANVLFE